MRLSVFILGTAFMAFAAGAETPPALFDGDEGSAERTPATALGRVIASGGAQRGGVGMKCMACHGLDDAGAGLGDFPGLAGQPAKYLVEQLEAFISGDRISPIMVPIASQLSDAERQAVSDYYASVAPKLSKFEHDAPTEKVQLGGTLAASGSDSVTACSQCHGGDETSGAAILRGNIKQQQKRIKYKEDKIILRVQNSR